MSTDRITILAVDDEMGICELTKEFLEMSGNLIVDTAYSVLDARRMLAGRHYDAIISDYQMPREDGIQFLKSLRASGNSIPFILFTGKGREDVVIDALNSGVDAYQQKGGDPVSQYMELEHRIVSLVSRHKAVEALRESESTLLRAELVARFGHWQFDTESRTYSGSPGMKVLCGVDKATLTSTEWRDIVLPEYHSRLNDVLRDLIESNGSYNMEYQIRRPSDGGIIDVHSQAEYDPDRKIVFGTMMDISERKIAERAERINREELQALNDELMLEKSLSETVIEGLPGIFYLYDAETMRMMRWNKNHEEISGFTAEEMLGKDVMDWFSSEDKGRMQESIHRLLSNGLDTIEASLVMKGGRKVPYLLKAKRFELRGRPFFMGLGVDITDRKRAEEALRISEERFDQLAEHNGNITWEIDTSGLYTYVSHVSEDAWGYHPDELIGKVHFFDLAPESDREMIKKFAFDAMERRERVIDYENRVVTKNGRIIVVRTSGIPVTDADGALIGYRGNDSDITVMKEMTRRMDLSMVALESSIDGISILDPEGRFILLNRAHAEMYGYDSPDELIEKNWRELIGDEERREFDSDILPALHRKGHWRGESRGLRKDGAKFAQDLSLTLFKDGGIISVVRDIGGIVQTREALYEANRKLNLLSSITRHDIKNQLMVLTSNLLLQGTNGLDERSETYRRNASSAAERISSMINFTREYENIGVRAPVWHDIRALVENTASEVKHEGVIVMNEIPQGLQVFADPLISKVFYNLVQNSVKHGGNATSIRFCVEEANDKRAIVCEDDGMGIAMEIKPILFAKGVGKEHGFGLFLCQEILAITNISITEEGTPGECARFIITPPTDGIRMADSGLIMTDAPIVVLPGP